MLRRISELCALLIVFTILIVGSSNRVTAESRLRRQKPVLLYISNGGQGTGNLAINFAEEVAPFSEKSYLQTEGKVLASDDAPIITPSVEGRWIWQDGTRLLFIPKEPSNDFLPGKSFSVNLKNISFRSGKVVPQEPLMVTLPPLQFTTVGCDWVDLRDEVPPARSFQVILAANYPVYADSLRGISIQVASLPNIGFTKFVTNPFTLVITASPMVLPASDSTISFSLPKGKASLYRHPGPSALHKGAAPCSKPIARSDWNRLEEAEKDIAYSITATVGDAPVEKPFHYPLIVNLQANNSPITTRGSAGKEVSEGIVLTPPHRGTWRFDSENGMIFTPEDPFVLGEQLTVSLSAFPGVVINSPLTTTIRLPQPTLAITDSQLAVDPLDPKTRRIVATIELSHPFLKGVLESRARVEAVFKPINLTVEAVFQSSNSTELVPFEISYDPTNSRRAYLKTSPIEVREESGWGEIVIERGVQADGGGLGTSEPVKQFTSLPSYSEIFQITGASPSEIVSANGQVERILALTTSQPVDDTAGLLQNLSLKLLPDCEVAESAIAPICSEKELTSWSDPREVDSRVEALSEPLTVTHKKTEEPERTAHLFSFTAPEKRQVLVTVKKGTLARGAFPLVTDARFVVQLGRLKRELKIMHDGALLSFSGDKKLGLTSQGVTDVRVGLRRILPSNAKIFAALSGGDFSNPGLTIDLESLAEEFSYDEKLSLGIKTKGQKTAGEMGRLYSFVDFSKFLTKGNPPRGLFILTVRSKAELQSPPDVRRLDERDAERALRLYAEQVKRVEECRDTTTSDESGDSSNSSEAGSPAPLCDQRLVLITDLGLVAKRNIRNEHDLFVMSFRSGKPLQGATVSLLGKNGVPLFTATSSSTGHVRFPSADTFINEKTPTTYTVTYKEDFSFLPYNRGDRTINLSRFDTGGVHDSEEFNSLQSYLFTDRGIYRPGDQVRLGLLLRKKGWQPLPAGLPLELSITDSRNKEVFRQPISFDQTGFSELRWDTNSDGATGTYRASLHLFSQKVNDRLAQIGGTSFRVDEFQPDRLSVKTEIQPEIGATFVNQRDARARVTVRNLFGTAANGAKASGEITVRPWSGILPKYENYRFRRTKREDLPTSAEKLGEQETDENGQAVFALDLEKYQEPIFEFTVAGEGFEKGSGRSVVASASTIASSLPYLVGFKPDGDLDFISKDGVRSIELIAVDTLGNRASSESLTATLFEDRYESTLVKQPNGLYAYQSVEKATLISESPLTINRDGTQFQLATKEPGRFRVVFADSKKQELLSVSYNVAGEGNVTKSLERNAELTITLDKREYAPGSEMMVKIVSPYSGSGLITIESDTVHAHHWFSSTTTASAHRIKVPKDLKGNAYLSVAFVRSFDSPEIFMSPLSYGVVPFSVSRAEFTAPIELKAPAEVVPGTDLPVTVTLAEKGKLLLFAVDEGILQFARYKNPQPLDHFFRKRALQVDTYQILDLILPEFELVQKLSSTGGDEDSGAGKYKNPFARKNKAPMAFWSGLVEKNAGSHEVAIPIPDYFSGAVRILALSASGDRIGTADSKVLAKGPFIIQPQQPYAVAPGDEFEVGALIGNNTEKTALSVSIVTPPNLSVISENPIALDIASGGDAPVRFRVKAGESFGPVELFYNVAHATKDGDPQQKAPISFSNSETVSVRPAAPFVVLNTQGRLPVDDQRNGKAAKYTTSRVLFREFRDVQTSISTTPFGLLRGVVRYLKEYPYGCTEQIVSQSFPALLLGKNVELGFSREDTDKFVQRSIKTLASRQQDTGAFGLWSRLGDADPFYSVYATHFLVVSRNLGVSVPSYMYDEALRYLRDYTTSVTYSWDDYRAQAYALYVLGIAGEIVTDKIRRLESVVENRFGNGGNDEVWVRFLLAAAYKVHQLDGDAERWYGQFTNEWQKTGYLPWNIGRDPAVLGLYLYLTHEHFQSSIKDKKFESYLWELSQEMLKGRMHSLSGSFALLGLGAFWEKFGRESEGSFTVTAQHGAEASQELSLNGYAVKRAAISSDDTTLTLKGDGSHQLYYQLMEAGFDREAAKTERIDGIGLTRRLRTVGSDDATSLAVTDKLIYEITINPSQAVNDIAVVAIIPGGFEIDLSEEGLGRRTSLPVPGESWKPEHIEVQEDRVLFFGDIGAEPKQFAFALKPLTKGRYNVPPLFAEGMYDPEIQYRGVSGVIEVRD